MISPDPTQALRELVAKWRALADHWPDNSGRRYVYRLCAEELEALASLAPGETAGKED